MIELSQNISDYISGLFGKETAEKYFQYIQSKPSSFIRVSRFCDENLLISQLGVYGVKLEKINAVPYAYKVLEGEEVIGKTLEYNLGKYYIQSLSSMIPPLVLSPNPSDLVMDTCSAPGSKATQMAEIMGNKGTLIVNEPNTDRLKVLVHNIDKTSLVNVGVIRNRGDLLSQVYNNHFDKILVDAPCSALGVLQKKGEVSNWWSLERVENITTVQRAILTAAIKMVKIGGEIVYSTCTLTPEENELIINSVLNKYPLEVLDIDIPLPGNEGFTSYKGETLNLKLSKARRILPWESGSEGFFIIKLRKTGDTESVLKPVKENNPVELFDYQDKNINKYLQHLTSHFEIDPEIWKDFRYQIKGTDIFFINKNWNDDNTGIFTRIGIQLGIIDKNDTAHLYTFGAQHLGNKIKTHLYHLADESQLRNYMNGGIIRTEEKLKKQYVVVYKGYVIGTAVGVSNGLKSQYPKSSRIHEIDHY